MDDSSSTCSTDSVPSAFVSGPYKGSNLSNNRTQTSPNRGKNQESKEIHDRMGLTHGGNYPQSVTAFVDGHSYDVTGSKVSLPESEVIPFSLKSEIRQHDKNIVEKEEVASSQKKLTSKDQVDAEGQSCLPSIGKKTIDILQQPNQSSVITTSITAVTTVTTSVEPALTKKPPSSSAVQTDKVLALASKSPPHASSFHSEAQMQDLPAKLNSPHQANAASRPSSAPFIPAPRPTSPIASTVQAVPILSLSVSADGRLGTDPSPSALSHVRKSYRNAIIGKTTSSRGAGFIDDIASSSQSVAYSQSPSMYLSSASMLPPQTPSKKEQMPVRPGLTFGCLKPEVVHSQILWKDVSYHESSNSSSQRFGSTVVDNVEKLDIYGKSGKDQYPAEIGNKVTPYHVQGTVGEEFPHLDIINDLLDDEQNIGRAGAAGASHYPFNRQYSLSGSSGQFDQFELYSEDGLHSPYGASNDPLQGLRDLRFQQVDVLSYANSHFDGLMRNQWPYRNTDLSMLSLGDEDANGYPYQFRDCLARKGNGYSYHPANGL